MEKEFQTLYQLILGDFVTKKKIERYKDKYFFNLRRKKV